MLLRGPLPIGHLGRRLGVSRQSARKVARQLEQRGFATTSSDADDARKVVVGLTDAGQAYGLAVIEVIAALNWDLAERVGADQLAATDVVLRAALAQDDALSVLAERIPAPVESKGHCTAASHRRVTRAGRRSPR
ncbi:MAG: MarR family winged helix-turn-helix transcriptional regulator, partial [Acidimicrobiales bacterium]